MLVLLEASSVVWFLAVDNAGDFESRAVVLSERLLTFPVHAELNPMHYDLFHGYGDIYCMPICSPITMYTYIDNKLNRILFWFKGN